jgi:Flp pilus assembly protein TadG
MRRLAHDERGAMAVAIGVLVIVLLPLGAVVIDAGLVFQERRELQNGADAGVLAYAYHCARTKQCDPATGKGIADEYVPANALDGTAEALSASYNTVTRTARVEARSHDGDQARISLIVAQLFGMDSATVHAAAEARITGVHTARTIPLTVCSSVWSEYTGGDPQTGLGYELPTDQIYLRYTSAENPDRLEEHERCDSYPGGFGWLTANSDCEVTSHVNGAFQGSPGNNPNPSGDCASGTLRNLLIDAVDNGTELLIPIFLPPGIGTGTSGTYTIIGFGAFIPDGFYIANFPQISEPNRRYMLDPSEEDCRNPISCLKGSFVDFVPIDAFGSDAVGEFGARTVRLTK